MNNKTSPELSNILSIDNDLRIQEKQLDKKEIDKLLSKKNNIHEYLINIDKEIFIHRFYDFFENIHPEFKTYIEKLSFSLEEISVDFDERTIINFKSDYTKLGFQANINIDDAIEHYFFQHTGEIEMGFLNSIGFIEFNGQFSDKNYIGKMYSHLELSYLKSKELRKINYDISNQEIKKNNPRKKL